jgi:hypothetical protein
MNMQQQQQSTQQEMLLAGANTGSRILPLRMYSTSAHAVITQQQDA